MTDEQLNKLCDVIRNVGVAVSLMLIVIAISIAALGLAITGHK